jgi:hypothetical protein
MIIGSSYTSLRRPLLIAIIYSIIFSILLVCFLLIPSDDDAPPPNDLIARYALFYFAGWLIAPDLCFLLLICFFYYRF